MLCGPLPPSFLNLRAIVKQDDNIRLTANGMNNHGQGTIAYHPDEHGLYKNRVVSLSLRRVQNSVYRLLVVLVGQFNGQSNSL